MNPYTAGQSQYISLYGDANYYSPPAVQYPALVSSEAYGSLSAYNPDYSSVANPTWTSLEPYYAPRSSYNSQSYESPIPVYSEPESTSEAPSRDLNQPSVPYYSSTAPLYGLTTNQTAYMPWLQYPTPSYKPIDQYRPYGAPYNEEPRSDFEPMEPDSRDYRRRQIIDDGSSRITIQGNDITLSFRPKLRQNFDAVTFQEDPLWSTRRESSTPVGKLQLFKPKAITFKSDVPLRIELDEPPTEPDDKRLEQQKDRAEPESQKSLPTVKSEIQQPSAAEPPKESKPLSGVKQPRYRRVPFKHFTPVHHVYVHEGGAHDIWTVGEEIEEEVAGGFG